MTTLQELKTKYQEEKAAREREYAAKEQAREAHQQEVLAEFFPQVCAYLSEREGVEQAELLQFGRIEGDWYSSGELDKVIFNLDVPGYSPLCIRLDADNLAGNIRAEWVVDNYDSYRRLDKALVEASRLFLQQLKWEEEEKQKTAKSRQQREVEEFETKRRSEEREQIFKQIADNPVAVALLKLFVEIQKNQNALNKQIASLEETNANDEYWHSEALASARRKIEQAQRAASEANDRSQSLQYEVYDLEDEVKKAKRQQRCW